MDFRYPKVLVFFISLYLQAISVVAEQEDFFIFFTGEDNGRLEPCGCATAQLGGLPRRHSFIDHLIIKEKKPFLLISNGDLVNGTSRQDELKFQTILESMNLMKYQVMNLGEKEFQFGQGYLESMKSLAQFSFISSNVKGQFFEKFFSYKVNLDGKLRGFKVIGILSPNFKSDLDPSVEILDPYQCIQDLITESTDFLILLYHGEKEEALKLAKAFPQIKVVITGHGYEEPPLGSMVVEEQTIVITPVKGKYVGKLGLKLEDDNQLHIKSLEYVELNEKIDDSGTIKSLLSDYQEILKGERIDQSMEGRNVDERKSFVGSQTCGTCHIGAFTIWQNSRHPHAYESIVTVKKQHDPDCLICHSTGFKFASGFAGSELTPHLAGVGCEACHGAGSLHVQSPLTDPMLKPGVGTCVGCHDPENSPKFDFNTYWEKIKH